MPLIECEQRTDAWFAARRGMVTASIAAACLGVGPDSRQKAWRTILGTEPRAENRHMRWGTEHEAEARAEYEAVSGNLILETGFWVHPEHDWLGASPDGLANSAGMVEVKCPGTLPTRVPIHHRIQCIIQLACTGRKWVDYFCWTPQGHFLQRVFAAGTEGLIRRLAEFRERYVLTGTEPPRKRRKKK